MPKTREMRFRFQWLAVLIGVVTLGFSAGGAQAPQGRSDLPGLPALVQRAQVEGQVRVIVGVRSAFVPEGRLTLRDATMQRAAIEQAQSDVLNRIAGLPVVLVRRFSSIPFFAAQMGRSALEQLATMPEVQSIEEDVAERPMLAESVALIGADVASQSGYSGAGWTVAVLDTGVDKSHPFLAGAVVSEACYSNAGGSGGQTSLCPSGVAESTAAGSAVNCPSVYEGCDHGTHVAGIAAGRRYPGGPAMDGVARSATLISLQVFTGFDAATCLGAPCALSYVSDQIAGLQRVYDLRNTFHIAAANMSLGGGSFTSQALCDADNGSRKAIIDQLRSAGIATVIASGNFGTASAISAPGCISSAVSVGSVEDGSLGTTADTVSLFSNGAPFLALLAPGQWINSSVPGGFFSDLAGTSMAAPHVAGAWALLRQRKPLASVTEVLQSLLATGMPVADPRPGGSTHPRIRVVPAIAAIRVDYMAFDAPASNTRLTQPFTVSGWALNMSALPGAGTGVDTVHVWAFPASGPPVPIGVAQYGSPRGDVAAAYGAQFTNSGWSITARELPPAVYTIAAYARNTFDGQFTQVASATNVTVAAGARLQVDTLVNDDVVQQPFVLSGWGIDATAPAGTGIDAVHVWAYRNPGSGEPPVFVGQATYGIRRDDIGSQFGSRFTNSGFSLSVSSLPAGRYLFAIYGHSTATHAFTVVQSVTLSLLGTAVTLDTPLNGSVRAQPFAISGWAIDPSAHSGAGIEAVHVWVYPDPGSGTSPTFVGLATIATSRADVGAALGGQFTNSCFTITINGLPAGHIYRFAIFARSDVSGEFALRTVDVTIP